MVAESAWSICFCGFCAIWRNINFIVVSSNYSVICLSARAPILSMHSLI